MYYLKKKQTGFSGIEADISNKILRDDIGWFPLGQSLKLVSTDETESLDARVTKICTAIDHLIADHEKMMVDENLGTNNSFL